MWMLAYRFRFLNSLVVNFGRCEVEETEWFGTDNNDVGNIGLGCDAINNSGQFSSNNIEGLWMESVVDCFKKRRRRRRIVSYWFPFVLGDGKLFISLVIINSPNLTSVAAPFPTLYNVYLTTISLFSTRYLLRICLDTKSLAVASSSAAQQTANRLTKPTKQIAYVLFIWKWKMEVRLIVSRDGERRFSAFFN